jgi:N-methylhydantoinase B
MNYLQSGFEVKELSAPIMVMRSEATSDTGGAGYHRGGAAQLADVRWIHGGFHRHFTPQVKKPPIGAHGGEPGRLGGDWIFDSAGNGALTNGWLPADLRGELYLRGIPMAGVIDSKTHELSASGDYVFVTRDVPAAAGSIARAISNGGGGWGNPFEREPERVMRDVRDGYVTVGGAAADYGVVILGDPESDPEGLRVDAAATRALREQRQVRAG